MSCTSVCFSAGYEINRKLVPDLNLTSEPSQLILLALPFTTTEQNLPHIDRGWNQSLIIVIVH